MDLLDFLVDYTGISEFGLGFLWCMILSVFISICNYIFEKAMSIKSARGSRMKEGVENEK